MRFDEAMALGRQALARTAPIYRVDSRGRHDQFGSAVLVTFRGRHFATSAGHVLSELADRELRIGGDDVTLRLSPPVFHSGAIGERRFREEPFDLSFVSLTADDGRLLAPAGFAVLDRPGPLQPIEEGRRLVILGFAARDFKAVPAGEVVQVEGTTLGAVAAGPDAYRRHGFNAATHLLIPFDRLRTMGPDGAAATPRLKGMSGCGIWDADSGRLLSLLTAHIEQHDKLIVSTRIEMLTVGLEACLDGRLVVTRRATA